MGAPTKLTAAGSRDVADELLARALGPEPRVRPDVDATPGRAASHGRTMVRGRSIAPGEGRFSPVRLGFTGRDAPGSDPDPGP